MAAAEWLGLNYAASAAVITLLSIHDTKRETIRVMAKRMAASLWPFCWRRCAFTGWDIVPLR